MQRIYVISSYTVTIPNNMLNENHDGKVQNNTDLLLVTSIIIYVCTHILQQLEYRICFFNNKCQF